jgi:cation diffusion facilitator family transporter
MYKYAIQNPGSFSAWFSIIINSLLFALKYYVGELNQSSALKADAWHTFSDSLTSVVLLISVKIASKPPDSKHPFGYGRIDLIASIIIGFALAMISIEFIKVGYEGIIHTREVNYNWLAITVTIFSIFLKEIAFYVSKYLSKISGLKAIEADAWHHRSDSLSSIVVLIGIFFNAYIPSMDGYLTILVGGLILYSCYEIIREPIHSLLGETPDEEFVKEIETIVYSVDPHIHNLHHIHIHRYGSHIELTFHIQLPPVLPLQEAYKISSQIHKLLLEKKQIDATIHIQPM